MRHRLAEARVATLGTVDGEGRPHLVPICFAWAAGDRLVTAVDHKPKRTSALARLAHVRAHPAVSVLVDHYSDDWDTLWWVRVDGTATVVDADADLVAPLVAKYAPYSEVAPAGPVIVVTVQRWQGWSAR
jgi:PPOX class probable F420-dependent enzyme